MADLAFSFTSSAAHLAAAFALGGTWREDKVGKGKQESQLLVLFWPFGFPDFADFTMEHLAWNGVQIQSTPYKYTYHILGRAQIIQALRCSFLSSLPAQRTFAARILGISLVIVIQARLESAGIGGDEFGNFAGAKCVHRSNKSLGCAVLDGCSVRPRDASEQCISGRYGTILSLSAGRKTSLEGKRGFTFFFPFVLFTCTSMGWA
ncbi:hypothetical protein V8C42DRAFT_328741 [Trichoderma barbatum]